MSEQYPYSFGKYRVEAEIGRGGFGAVFRALDLDLERPVAIKIMDPIYLRDRRWVARFRREAKVMAKLDHPHIVPIYDTGEENGRLYLAMKLVDGPDLTHLIAQEGRLPWDIAVKITGQVASALDYAHERNIIHRDLKPGNILVSNGDAVLTDFGLAKMLEDNSMSLSVSGGIAGTYNYMPPEVFNNEDVSPASDVYALGCVLYEMLVGKMLFDGKTTAAIVGAHLKGISLDEPLPQGIPAGTRQLLQTALAREPEDRYHSTGEMAEEMARLSSDRLAEPYAALQQAMSDSRWQEALEIAARISAQDPNYRDLVALEEQAMAENETAQRRHWAAQWQTSAEEALAADNFDEVRGALNQWRRVAPNDPQLPVVEKELHLAEQYVVLQQLIAAGNWADAEAAAAAIDAQDPSFRDITALKAEINAHMEPPPKATVIDTPQDEQDLSTAGAAMVGAAALRRQDSIPAKAPDYAVKGRPQDPAPAPRSSGRPSKKVGAGIPAWAWWVGGIVAVLVLVFGILAIFGGGGEEDPAEEPAPAEEFEAPAREAPAEEAPAEEEAEEEPAEEAPAEEAPFEEEAEEEPAEEAPANVPNLGGREVTIALENAYLPFNYIDPDTGEPAGWDYVVWGEICNLLNCTPVYIESGWEGMIQAVADGQFDAAADGITITENRSEIVDFSDGYVAIEQRLLVRLDEDRIESIEDIVADESLVLGTQIGTTNYETATTYLDEDRIQTFERFSFTVQALVAGDVDAVMVDETAGLGYQGENAEQLKLVGPSLSRDELGFIYPLGSDLVDPVNAAIDELKANGFLQEVNASYFGPEFDVTYADLFPPEEEMAFESLSVAAENCDYGGKIFSIEAVDELTVQFNLCRPDPTFLAKIAFIPFGIQSQEWLESTGGTGELLEKPVGTGPYMVDEWIRGDSVVYKRFDDYWGEAAPAETAVLRWNQEGAARLVELQSGTVDFITNISPDDYEAVLSDPSVELIPQDNPNILYVAFTNTFEPFDNQDVRKAIAMGIDRQRLVDNFYPEGSEVASHFTPCSIPNGCQGEEWYEFDPEGAKQLLADAGFPDGFETSIYYRDVFRTYLPEPGLVAVDIQDQLRENLGIEAQVVVMESGEFIAESTDGDLDGIHLLGWSADYPHVTNFLDFHFTSQNPQFGDPHPEIYATLEEASQIPDLGESAPYYEEANNAIKDLVPMVPIAHSAVAHAALASVEGAYYPPFGSNEFYRMDPGKDTLVYMQNNEPISLYCSDETDGESLRPCQQAVETLFEYEVDSGDVVPELATACDSNEDGTVWTCTLREGVMFHDGTMLDANDVVTTWAIGIDAANPLHVGNTGGFVYYSYLWDGLINGE